MNWWNRMTSALNAFWTTYNGSGATTPIAVTELGFNRFDARLARYALFEAYYSNVAYNQIYKYAEQRKTDANLYKKIRTIYNPVLRLVNLYTSYVYGGSITPDLTSGAIPLTTDNAALRAAAYQLLTWSRFDVTKQLYVEMGAKLGDAPIKVVDDVERGKVRLELLDPHKIRTAIFDAVGNVKAIVIEYERDDEDDIYPLRPSGTIHPIERAPRTWTYTEIITHDWFETYRNGELLDKWRNPYGFIPVVIGGHQPTLSHWSKPSFYGILPKIDEINDSASILNDQVRKSVNVLWAFIGATVDQVEFPDKADDGRDSAPYITLPENADVKPLVASLQIDAALDNIREMLAEVERDAPELALQRIRERGGNTSLPAVKAQYGDALGRIEAAQGSYDSTLVRALQMGATIGGFREYPGFTAFNLDSYDRGDLEMAIRPRPVIGEQLSANERITALSTAASAPRPYQRLILQELGKSEGEIDAIIGAA